MSESNESDIATENYIARLKFIIEELLKNKSCSCGGWSCPRCLISIKDAIEVIVPKQEKNNMNKTDKETFNSPIEFESLDGECLASLSIVCSDCGEPLKGKQVKTADGSLFDEDGNYIIEVKRCDCQEIG